MRKDEVMKTQSNYKSPAGEKAAMDLYDSALERWPVPYETLTLPTRHGTTFVIASGETSRPPMLLLHGAGTSSAVWGADVAEYSRHYRVYAVDLPGEAGKSAPNRPAWDSPAFAEWLEDVFDGLKIDRAILVGASQGGWTALKFTVANPARVEKLVLVCPGGVIPTRASFFIRAMLLLPFGRWGARRIVRMLFGSQPVPDGVEDILTVIMSQFKPRTGIPPIFSDAELQRLTMPTFLLGGDQDALFDMSKIAARLRQFVPFLDVTIIPGGGHALLNPTGPIMAFLSASCLGGRHQVQRNTQGIHGQHKRAL
jgi:pimeloyl-ACP methyl ester carboxylesterase